MATVFGIGMIFGTCMILGTGTCFGMCTVLWMTLITGGSQPLPAARLLMASKLVTKINGFILNSEAHWICVRSVLLSRKPMILIL